MSSWFRMRRRVVLFSFVTLFAAMWVRSLFAADAIVVFLYDSWGQAVGWSDGRVHLCLSTESFGPARAFTVLPLIDSADGPTATVDEADGGMTV